MDKPKAIDVYRHLHDADFLEAWDCDGNSGDVPASDLAVIIEALKLAAIVEHERFRGITHQWIILLRNDRPPWDEKKYGTNSLAFAELYEEDDHA